MNTEDERKIITTDIAAVVVVLGDSATNAKLPGHQMHDPPRTLRPPHDRPPLSTERHR